MPLATSKLSGPSPPTELTLEFRPQARFDVIDLSKQVVDRFGDKLARHQRALYCSHHTTAGFLEQSLCARLRNDADDVDSFIRAFRQLFPPDADYRHDQLHLRHELSEEQRQNEPPNADSHLTFIGSGLNNCVTYLNRPSSPVYFIDLDGVYKNQQRLRKTTVIGFDREENVAEFRIDVPVSKHAIDAVNLRDPRLGVCERIRTKLSSHDISSGRVNISLDAAERNSALTVNEYETLLMKHDLAEVLRDPVQFMAEKGKHMLLNPRAIPNKTLNYAKFDMVRVYNELIDVLGITETRLEKLIARYFARPASRFLRTRASINLMVAAEPSSSQPVLVQGKYQSPILVQWKQASRQVRRLNVRLTRFR